MKFIYYLSIYSFFVHIIYHRSLNLENLINSLKLPEQEGFKNFMELVNEFKILLFHLAINYLCTWWHLKPLIKNVRRREDIWQNEVKQTPKFMQIILKGSTSKQEFEVSLKISEILMFWSYKVKIMFYQFCFV